MNSMKDAFSEAIKKRGESGPTLNIKISVDKADEGLAPSKLEPESPHEDEAQDEALIDKKLAEAGAVPQAPVVDDAEDDPEMKEILMSRGEGMTREPRNLSERAAMEYRAKNKKA